MEARNERRIVVGKEVVEEEDFLVEVIMKNGNKWRASVHRYFR